MAGVFLDGGFDVVVEDVIIGPIPRVFLALVPVPEFHLAFLDPDAASIQQRELERDRIAYGPPGTLHVETTGPVDLNTITTWCLK